jgi:hypothetical protein
VPSNTFYEDNNVGAGGYDSDQAQNEDLLKRKRAWAELEREQDEVKRNIKSILKTAPESRVMDDPIMAERVRGVRYAPQSYQDNEDKGEKAKLKEQLKKEEKIDNSVSHSSSMNTHQKRQWTAENATSKQPEQPAKKDTTPQKKPAPRYEDDMGFEEIKSVPATNYTYNNKPAAESKPSIVQ